jgi:hypothetical protein
VVSFRLRTTVPIVQEAVKTQNQPGPRGKEKILLIRIEEVWVEEEVND